MKNFFVSYNGKDKAWAEWIAYQLEEAGYSTVIQAWDFQAGGNFVLEMQKATREAERTIAVLSQNYLEAEYTQPEWAAAFAKDPQGKERKLVPVRIAECKLDGLFPQIVYIDLVGKDEQTARDALINGVKNERAKPAKSPAFPGQPSTTTTSKPKPEFPGTAPTEKPWNVPYPRNPFFTGREKVLDTLHQAIAAGKTTALTQLQAISGLGGIGKTQTAVEYAYRYRDEYAAVLWVKAETREALTSDFVVLAQLLELPQKDAQEQDVVVAAVKRWLESNDNWLLILDNADDLAIARQFLPTTSKGHVLLTTRARNTGAVAECIEIDDMEPDEGALFLLRRAQVITKDAPLTVATTDDQATAKAIATALGGLPLALDQAGAFIAETPSSLTEYLTLYKQAGAKLLAQRGELLPDDHPSVTITFSLAFQKVEEKSQAAADLIRACAFLAPDAIPEEILTEGGKELGETLASITSQPIDFLNALREAGRFSLIDRSPDNKTLDIHRLVQQVIKDTMDQDTQRQWAERVVHAINAVFPDPTQVANWPACDRFLPHAQVCADLIERWALELQAAARLLSQVADYLTNRAQYVHADSLYQDALTIYEKMFGFNHTDTATILHNLAWLYFNRGLYPQAEPLYRRALAIREQTFGPNHPHVAATLSNLALLYTCQGLYPQAEPLYRRALAIREQTFGPNHPHVAATLNNLALLYDNQGLYDQAETLYQHSLTTYEKALGSSHLDTARSLNNLAQCYAHQGLDAQAESLFLRALVVREQILGLDHPHTAGTLSYLAMLYIKQGLYIQAEPLCRRVLDVWEKTVPNHPYLEIFLESYASLLRKTNRKAEAEKLEAQAREIQGRKT